MRLFNSRNINEFNGVLSQVGPVVLYENFMKNLISRKAAKVVGILALTAIAAIGVARPINVEVNGQRVQFTGTRPMQMGDHVMIPLRGVFEKMGASVDWKESNQTVLAQRGTNRVELRINDRTAYINGNAMAVNNPAVMIDGSTMVPIRFVSESLGATVDWDETAGLVSIQDSGSNNANNNGNGTGSFGNGNNGNTGGTTMLSVQPVGSVIPLRLDTDLDSKIAHVGDRFLATIDTKGEQDFFGLPNGTKVQGHVSFAQPKDGDTPGVLGLIYDRILMLDGRKIPIEATLIGLDNKSVTNRDGRITANNSDKSKEDMKFVGTGAGAGALLAIVTKGNILTDAVLGGALGYLYQNLLGNKSTSKNVVLDRGTPLGLRVDREVSIRVRATNVNKS